MIGQEILLMIQYKYQHLMIQVVVIIIIYIIIIIIMYIIKTIDTEEHVKVQEEKQVDMYQQDEEVMR